MKKIVMFSIILLMALNMLPVYYVSAKADLISSMQTSLKNTENPKRLEASFNLGERINLSQGSANIIFEYLAKDSGGNLTVIYKKDKSWSGYLNSYDNYPAGERKYSSGVENNTAYSNNVPPTTIYTSTKTGASIDVTSVDAVRITVYRADGSGEKVTVYSDGTTSDIERIDVPVTTVDVSTGITLQSTTMELPADTVLVADEMNSGPVFNTVNTVLSTTLNNVNDFVVFNIKLESNGEKIQPDGKVKISIPIPEDFNSSNVAVYRIDDDNITQYPVTVTSNEGIEYATFETEHFSIYALAQLEPAAEEKEAEVPKTGDMSMIYFYSASVIISISMIMTVLFKKSKTDSRHS